MGMMQAVAHDTSNKSMDNMGAIGGISKEVASEMIHKTPSKTRKSFAKILAAKRKKKK